MREDESPNYRWHNDGWGKVKRYPIRFSSSTFEPRRVCHIWWSILRGMNVFERRSLLLFIFYKPIVGQRISYRVGLQEPYETFLTSEQKSKILAVMAENYPKDWDSEWNNSWPVAMVAVNWQHLLSKDRQSWKITEELCLGEIGI